MHSASMHKTTVSLLTASTKSISGEVGLHMWTASFVAPRPATCQCNNRPNTMLTKTARAPSAIRELYALPEVNRSKLNKNGSPSMSIERLADVLIASRCGAHSLGLIYEFLLKSHGNPKQARADFVMFLSGELPSRLLKEAQLWVSEEQGCEPPASIEDPIMATEHAGDPSCVPQASSNSRYEPIQVSW